MIGCLMDVLLGTIGCNLHYRVYHFIDGTPCAVKVACTVWAGGKNGRYCYIVGYSNSRKFYLSASLGLAAESAREGDFTKAAMYVKNIADVFFPTDGGEDPVWPNAANNAFLRAAYGMIDYYLEEEMEYRRQAQAEGVDPRVMETHIDELWGYVTLYNCYQLFVVLSAKKVKNPVKAAKEERNKIIESYNGKLEAVKKDESEVQRVLMELQDELESKGLTEERVDELKETQGTPIWEDQPEKDALSLFFAASQQFPRNTMRNLVANADNALKSMGAAEKMLASVYGIAITAMVRCVWARKCAQSGR